MVDRN